MKKYVSVFMLFVRSSIYGVLGLLLGMGIGQAIIFAFDGLKASNLEWALSQQPSFSGIVITLGLLCGMLNSPFCDRGGRMNNTLQRLNISEKQVFWMQAAANGLMIMLFFLFQGLMFVLFCFWYDPEVDFLTILVVAYDNPLFHTFFPLGNWMVVLTNLIVIAGLAICCAAYPMRQRHNKQSITTFLMLLVSFFYLYLQKEGDHLEVGYCILIMLASTYCITVALCGTMSLEVDDYA